MPTWAAYRENQAHWEAKGEFSFLSQSRGMSCRGFVGPFHLTFQEPLNRSGELRNRASLDVSH